VPSQGTLRPHERQGSSRHRKGSNYDLAVLPALPYGLRDGRALHVGGTVVESLEVPRGAIVAEGEVRCPEEGMTAGPPDDNRLPQRQTVRSLDFKSVTKGDA
jgi:hypothetical protein